LAHVEKDDISGRNVCSTAFLCNGTTKLNCNAVTIANFTSGYCEDTTNAYIDVNCTNINSLTFYETTFNNLYNWDYILGIGICSYNCMYALACKCGANFQFGTPTISCVKPLVHSPDATLPGGGAPV